jgi:hypothetical protein
LAAAAEGQAKAARVNRAIQTMMSFLLMRSFLSLMPSLAGR